MPPKFSARYSQLRNGQFIIGRGTGLGHAAAPVLPYAALFHGRRCPTKAKRHYCAKREFLDGNERLNDDLNLMGISAFFPFVLTFHESDWPSPVHFSPHQAPCCLFPSLHVPPNNPDGPKDAPIAGYSTLCWPRALDGG